MSQEWEGTLMNCDTNCQQQCISAYLWDADKGCSI